MSSGSHRLRAVVAATALAVVATTVATTAPSSAGPRPKAPSKPGRVTVVAVGNDRFTVTVAKARRAIRYRVRVAAYPSQLSTSTRATRPTAKRRISVTGVPATGRPVYFRVEALGKRGTSRASTTRSVVLRPRTPARLAATSRSWGTWVTWSGAPAERYVVQQATNAQMTQGVRTWTTRSTAQTFTPYDLAKGTRYWFRVRAESGSYRTGWSATSSAVVKNQQFDLRVMSHNVLRRAQDGSRYPSGRKVAPWNTVRGPAVVRQIQASGAQVVALQEAGDWTDHPVTARPSRGVRQADWIVRRLGPNWSLAPTEGFVGNQYGPRTGSYIIYDRRRFESGYYSSWLLAGRGTSNPSRSSHVGLQDLSVSMSFMVASSHLFPGLRPADDVRRQSEVRSLLSQVARYRVVGTGIYAYENPMLLLGDHNTDTSSRYPADRTGAAFDAARVVEAGAAAQSVRTSTALDSYNQLMSPNPATGTQIDQIRVTPGVGVRSWSMPVNTVASDHNPVVADLTIPWDRDFLDVPDP